MKVSDFVTAYPEFSINFLKPIRNQRKIFDREDLINLPTELSPEYKYHHGGRGRPNLNQTLTHYQCATCKRVLRNDFFYAPESFKKRNQIYSHCIECSRGISAKRYTENADPMRQVRHDVWKYIAPECFHCGFSKHVSAMDMHHIRMSEDKERVSVLISQFAAAPSIEKAERLLIESSRCIPLCANCHRMLHSKAISINSSDYQHKYNLTEFLSIFEHLLPDEQKV